jgi:hypothetical protein
VAGRRDYFYLHFANDPQHAVALAPDDPDLDKRLAGHGVVTDWSVLRFQLEPGEISDYLGNSFAYRLCSEKLMAILETARARIDSVQWLPAVVTRDGVDHRYSILHFPEVPEVLDLSRTLMAGPVIVKAHLDRKLVDGHRLFGFPEETVRLVVADDVKRQIEAGSCSGIVFSSVPAT